MSLLWAGREHQELRAGGAGLCLAITTQFHFASSWEDRENARLPMQEGKRKMRNGWGCESWFPRVEQGL